MTDLTPTTGRPVVGDRRTLRFALADENGDPVALSKAKCTLLQEKPRSASTDVTADSAEDGNDLVLSVDLDTGGVWQWRLEYDDDAGTGFVEVEEYRLRVQRREVPAAS